MRNSTLAFLSLSALLLVTNPAWAKRIEAVKGKRYSLTKRHGPCMIMVASLKTREGAQQGPTAEEAAAELVYELRRKGIPAYVYETKKDYDTIRSYDRRSGRYRERAHWISDGRVVVMAGNYPSIDDGVAQRTLHYIKKFKPRCFGENARYVRTPGRQGPLSGAFLSYNPLLTSDEIKQMARQSDPLLKKMNTKTGNVSLLNSHGQYTLVVATFFGKSSKSTQWGGSLGDIAAKFKIDNDGESPLQQAERDAWYLANLLRGADFQKRLKKHTGRNYKSYVYHDYYKSVVTIGEFKSPNDPRIAQLQALFGAKMKPEPQTGKKILVAEIVNIPGGKPTETGRTAFLFDPTPKLMQVPTIR